VATWQATIIKGKPYRLEIDPPGLNSGIQPVQGVAHREGSEGSSHQQAEKWEIFVKIHNRKPPFSAEALDNNLLQKAFRLFIIFPRNNTSPGAESNSSK
jgi:hypothetical protein